MKYLELNSEQQFVLLKETREKTNLLEVVIEKDEWVTAVIRALFALPYSEHLLFKGGTSLSKCWRIIERFSEDVDIAINRELLGFSEDLSNNQIHNKLRKSSYLFIKEKLSANLEEQMKDQGISPNLFSINVEFSEDSTKDPVIVEIVYRSIVDGLTYTNPTVKLEIGCRSMREPFETVKIRSIVDETFANTPFSDTPFEVNAVLPQRTFIEKLCLLQEEFAKPQSLVRTNRMSRHLYDIVKITETNMEDKALNNSDLWHLIIEHRKKFVKIKNFDYELLNPQKINFIPPEFIISQWKADYETMQETMIYGKSLPFNELIDKIQQLNKRINEIKWQ
jgi:predicted nucleotidyltransferase component of viral defense system